MCAKTLSRASIALVSLLFAVSAATANTKRPAISPERGSPNTAAAATRFVRAYVVDDRLSVLRQQPDVKSRVIQRLRLGRPVYIIASRGGDRHTRFHRVAVTRRTRGWIHAGAVAIPGRSGEDKRVLELAENANDGLDRIALCSLLADKFGNSPLVPRALLLIADEAERSAEAMYRRVAKRLETAKPSAGASLRDYYVNDVALDRFNKLLVFFEFNEALGEYIYDGAAYRSILIRFPASAAAQIARDRLALTQEKLARRH